MSDIIEPEPLSTPPTINEPVAFAIGISVTVEFLAALRRYDELMLMAVNAFEIPAYIWGDPIRINKDSNPDE